MSSIRAAKNQCVFYRGGFMDLPSVNACIVEMEQWLDGYKSDFSRLIPPAVWREMAANLRFAMMVAGVSEEQVHEAVYKDLGRINDRSMVATEFVERCLSEGGDLRFMLVAMHLCGFHPLAIFKKDLRAAVASETRRAAMIVGEGIVSVNTPESNMFLMVKGICFQCHYVYRTTEPRAKFCPQCGVELGGDLEQIGLWQHLDRAINGVELIQRDTRTANCMQNSNIFYVGQLVQRSEAELLKTRNFGRRSLLILYEALKPMGLTLGMNVGEWKPPK